MYKRQENLRLSVGARSLTSDIDRIVSDVRLMAVLPSLAAALENNDAPSAARFADDLVALSASRRVYDQLRWIDESGVERVRVDFLQNRPYVVPEDRLQNKALRDYFKAAMALDVYKRQASAGALTSRTASTVPQSWQTGGGA